MIVPSQSDEMGELARFLRENVDIRNFTSSASTVIDQLEDFLINSADFEIRNGLPALVPNLIQLLDRLIATPLADLQLHTRILHLLRLFRPSLLDISQLGSIQEILLKTLMKTNDDRCSSAFVILLDFIAVAPKAQRDQDRILLIQWIRSFLLSASEPFQSLNTFLVVVHNIRHLLGLFERQFFANVSTQLFDCAISLASKLVKSPSRFSPDVELLLAKTFRLFARLIDLSGENPRIPLPPQCAQSLTDFSREFSDDVRSFHSFSNYLFCISCLCTYEDKGYPEGLMDFLGKYLIANLAYMVHPPFNRSRRLVAYARPTIQWVSVNRRRQTWNSMILLPQLWLM